MTDHPPTTPIEAADFTTAHKHVLAELHWFTDQLHQQGVTLPAVSTLEAARALSLVGLSDKTRVQTVLQATLLSAPDEYTVFAAVFPEFWQRLRARLEAVAIETPTQAGDRPETHVLSRSDSLSVMTADEPRESAEQDVETSGPDSIQPTSTQQIATSTDDTTTDDAAAVRGYSAMGPAGSIDPERALGPQHDTTEAAVTEFVETVVTLAGRRHRPATSGRRPDFRQALRKSIQTGGAPIDLPMQTQVTSERNCCVLIDVSGSVLDTLNLELLLLLVTTVTERARNARVFLFDTELTEATDAFADRHVDPLTALRNAEVTWGGGTQIGRSLETLKRTAPDAIDRQTAVIMVSDGLDVGDDDVLAESIAWIARRSAAIIWLNPLAVSRAYEPTARGMATCLPFVDGLFGFADAADLTEATRQLSYRGLHGPIGYRYDRRRHGGPSTSNTP